MKKLLLPLILLFVVGGMIGLFVIANQSSPETKSSTATLLGEKQADQGRAHIKPGEQHAAYNSELPSSGPHYSAAAPWGIKDSALVDETLIHNLEHGGIEIAYKPDLPQVQIDQLKNIFAKLPASSKFNKTKAVLVPRAANTRPVELAAWTYTLALDSVDSAKITEFYNDHLDKGPELEP